MGARAERRAWVETIRGLAAERGLRYEPVGGLNPRDAPAALCPGGSNRITGQLADGFWGASCDADEREHGRLWGRAVLPGAVLAKSHLPALAEIVPAFNVESIERRSERYLRSREPQRVQFESIAFNRRFIATVPREHDPVALRELFSPGFLDWATTIDREVDFGASDRQLWMRWVLRERSRDELVRALAAGAELFRRVRRELEDVGAVSWPAGPWNAGLEPFPDQRP